MGSKIYRSLAAHSTLLHENRYDVRATLSEIKEYEAPPGGYDRMAFLSPMEQRAEQLCEEERYFSLYNNDFEEELYKGKTS